MSKYTDAQFCIIGPVFSSDRDLSAHRTVLAATAKPVKGVQGKNPGKRRKSQSLLRTVWMCHVDIAADVQHVYSFIQAISVWIYTTYLA